MIGIIYVGHIKRAPYLLKYTSELEQKNMPYEIIYWNRQTNNEEKIDHNLYNANKIHEFALKSYEQRSPYLKLKDFIKFRKFVLKTIKEKKYEKLIILTTMSSFIIYDLLMLKYKKKYILDYRDASFENNKLFYHSFYRILKNARYVMISSRGFKKILPSNIEYVISHNINFNYFNFSDFNGANKKKNLPINVAFIGGLRETDYMKKIVQKFSNNNSFELYFHGGGENLDELKRMFINEKNIHFTGPYKEVDKANLIMNADLLLYNYPVTFNNKVALANKYYDCLVFKKPLIGERGTYSGELIEEKKLGISLSMDENDFTEKILSYYNSIDENEFNNIVNKELNIVQKEEKIFMETISKFLEE